MSLFSEDELARTDTDNTETLVRRALASYSFGSDFNETSDLEEKVETCKNATIITDTNTGHGSDAAGTSKRRRQFPFLSHANHETAMNVVEETLICNSRENEVDIEIQQGYAEAGDYTDNDDDGNDGGTVVTHPSDMEMQQDSFARRVGEPLVTLLSEEEINHTYKFSDLQLSVLHESEQTFRMPGVLDLLDVECGRGTLVCKPVSTKARSVTSPTLLASQEKSFKHGLRSANQKLRLPMQRISPEVGWAGQTWRVTLIKLLQWTMDDVNRLRLSRVLQISLPFLTGYESYLLASVIEGLDNRSTDMNKLWKRAFSNRNVSRLIVQSLRPRYDFIFHWDTAIIWNRPFDILGRFPIVGAITRFPATENFPATRNHALASIFRVLLGEGNWINRVLTGGREGLITDDPNTTAQNLTAESNGFEVANRNQYGTHFGRIQTTKFRADHRFPTDEAMVRTFFAQPIPTVTNNGIVYSLRQLAKHWHNMLNEENGNFAHQRMEQLNPFETLRFHMPALLVTLSSLRGRNIWDAKVLGPIIEKLQRLQPEATADRARRLVRVLLCKVVVPVSGGIASVVEPFRRWLEAIYKALNGIEEEAKQIYQLITPMELGIRAGYDIMSHVSWKVPSERALRQAIRSYISGQSLEGSGATEKQVASALERTSPRDKRTLIELIQKKQGHTLPARMLLARVKTLLQREIRRDILNGAIRGLSKGTRPKQILEECWYWLEGKDSCELYCYTGKNGDKCQFIHVDSGSVKFVTKDSDEELIARTYVPIAEAICRAQKTFMTIELKHGKKYSYNAFMEFTPLRIALRRLIVVSQMACEVLDNARLNILSEIQRSNNFNSNPQNLVVVGAGPAGMLTTIHCTENCLVSGGVVKLFEARDAFAKGGSTYERAQIVRLDARLIAMMRYHCGTGFEDSYIPASGETDSQLGNTLPAQGFVEITIKDLENMLHVEISRLWSRGLITVFSDSRSRFDHITNSLTKLGENLKVGDVILRESSKAVHTCKCSQWKVVEVIYTKLLGVDDLKVGEEYGVYYRPQRVVMPFRLIQVDLDTKVYNFEPLVSGVEDLHVNVKDLPSVYPAGTGMNAHADVHGFLVESLEENQSGRINRDFLLMDSIKTSQFTLLVGNTHVVESIGKPNDSRVHIRFTTPEPYGVCCLEGLKVSMGMHNFGEKRWGSGILDDIRSLNDQNTRIIGDFTKMVRIAPILETMYKLMVSDNNWVLHFHKLVRNSSFPSLNTIDPVGPKILSACHWLANNADRFHRRTLQTRFFETGDNFYLGMELNREFDQWKKDLVAQLLVTFEPNTDDIALEKHRDDLKQALSHGIDRLWYFACLEVIRTGDVYNPGARHRVPRLYTIDASIPTSLGRLEVGESFRLFDSPQEKFEVLVKRLMSVVVRNVEGYVFVFEKASLVTRESNLTRCPDGNKESKVALSTFPVSHYINHRTMRLAADGNVFAFVGDEQSTPHFMRYSGLTGAGVNAMCFNDFLKKANEGVPLMERFKEYSKETNWSNGEVVTRGTLGNYGDGFLRPGCSYEDCIDYLHSKHFEIIESDQDLDAMLSKDWLTKMAAAFIPRGMEVNDEFRNAFRIRWRDTVFEKLCSDIQNNDEYQSTDKKLNDTLLKRKAQMNCLYNDCSGEYWERFLHGLPVEPSLRERMAAGPFSMAACLSLVCDQIIEIAEQARLSNSRLPSELFHQPRAVDSVVDDFAVEAQTFANSLTLSAAFGAGTLAFRLVNTQAADLMSVVFGALNILIAFGTMTNVARYRIRNEEARIVFADEKLSSLKREVFALMSPHARAAVPKKLNPFLKYLKRAAQNFQKLAVYYDYELPQEFIKALEVVLRDIYNAETLKSFQVFVIRELIVNKYHVNSYVQEALVSVYKVVDELLSLMNEVMTPGKTDVAKNAKSLFFWLLAFEERLESTLQRGPIRWGFIKRRKFVHWDVCIVIRYFYSLFWMVPCSDCGVAPIENHISLLQRKVRILSKSNHEPVLCRALQDVETLYWATRESDIASLIFVVVFLTFATSIVFTLANIFGIQSLTDLAFFSAAASALGAILASFHFIRKLIILTTLWLSLGIKATRIPPRIAVDLRLVRRVTLTQIVLTLVRLFAVVAAAVAMPYSIAVTGYSNRIDSSDRLPFAIASVSIVAAVGSTFFFFVVENIIRYKLSTELGPLVCYIFKDEINAMYCELTSAARNTIDTRQVHDRELWEYTARMFLHEYRFDTVFAADRFGQILQFIQDGMKNVPVLKLTDAPNQPMAP